MDVLDPDLRQHYPFHSHCLNLDGNFYHFVDEGQGETVLIVHGNPAWSFHFRRYISLLRDNYRVVAPDHMGCGLSDKPVPYPYVLKRHIDNLQALVDRKGLKDITLIMHDWGGPIGLGLAVRQPENIKRMVLFNTVGFPLPEIPWFLRLCRKPLLGGFLVERLNLFLEGAIRLGLKNGFTPEPDVRRGYMLPHREAADRRSIISFIRDIPAAPSHPSFGELQKIERGLPKLRHIPSLIVWGAKDPVFTQDIYELWPRHLPDAERHLIPNGGHYVFEDSFEEASGKLLSFLSRSRTDVRGPSASSASAR